LDQISDEYSSFYLNHSDFPVCSSFQSIENNFYKATDTIMRTYIGKQNRLSLIRSIRDMEFLDLKLINKTQKQFNNIVIENILNQCENDIYLCFDEFLIKNNLLDRSSNIMNQIIDVTQDDKNRIDFFKRNS